MKGTIKELVGKVSVNGHVATQPELSILFGLGLANKVGQVKVDGARGKPATIWELQASGLVEFAEVTATAETAEVETSEAATA